MDDEEFKQKLDRLLEMIEKMDYEAMKSIREKDSKKQMDTEKEQSLISEPR